MAAAPRLSGPSPTRASRSSWREECRIDRKGDPSMPAANPGKLSPLNPAAAEPFYRQIYDRCRSALASGVLKPGDRIPSARALTKELGLARGTVDAAYSLLAAEGYVQ